MRVCLTGGAGFIGSHVQDLLCAAGYESLVIDDLSTGSLGNLTAHDTHGCYRLMKADICHPPVMSAIVEFQPSAVVHLAGQPSVIRSLRDPVRDADANVVGSLRVVEAARRCDRAKVVFAASGGTAYDFGPEPSAPRVELLSRAPTSPYGLSKRVVIEYLALYERLYGLPWAALAIGNAYGPRQPPEQGIGVIGIFTDSLVRGEQVTIYGDGDQRRDYVHVTDVAAAFLAAITRGHGLYNVGTGTSLSVREVLAEVCDVLGVPDPVVRFLPARDGEVSQVLLDVATAAEFGWRPTIALRQGIHELAAYLAPRQGGAGTT